MKITKLTVNNFMRVKAVEVTPDGPVVTVAGRNAAGKTSVLQSIEAAFGGGKSVPKDAVRHGAKKGYVIAETEELIVKREFGPNGKTGVVVTGKDGAVFASPQGMLDKLVGSISFDPLAFTRMKPAEQADMLRQLVGLDFSKWDAARKAAFDQRTDVNRERKRLQGAIEKLPEPTPGAPSEEVSVLELARELREREARNARQDREREQLDALRNKAKALAAELDRTNEQGIALAATVGSHVWADTDEIKAKIANAEKDNAAARVAGQRATLEESLDAEVDKSEALTKRIEEIDGLKAEAIAKAKYPVEGIEARDDGVYFNGVPLAQSSQAELIRVSVAIGAKVSGDLRVMLVRDGSLLDRDSMALLAKLAADMDMQVWLETCAEGQKYSVLIEDGIVASAESVDTSAA